jgi:AAA domain
MNKNIRDYVGEALGRAIRRSKSATHKAKVNGSDHRSLDDNSGPQQPAWKAGAFSARQLQSMQFPPIAWIVPNIIPAEGVTLLCSKPKFGKSWLVYDLCIACTTDRFTLGTIKPAQGDVLYLALEDSKRRLQRRTGKLLPTFGATWPERLTLKTEWRRLHEGGLDDIRAWHVDIKQKGGKPILVGIDVLARVRKPVGTHQLYEADYAALAGLTTLANEVGLAILVLHHTRKMVADDLMETVSGSYGVSGAVDTILVMANKPTGGAVLNIRGRGVESAELAIEFNRDECRWRVLGDAAEVHVSSQRAKIIAALKDASQAMTIAALIETTGMRRNPLEVLLGRMAKDGAIKRVGKGQYAHNDYIPPPNDDPTSEEKLGTKGHRSVASVSSSTRPTVCETERRSVQESENKVANTGICPSVASVRKSAEAALARGSEDGEPAFVPAQTGRTDRRTGPQVSEQLTELGAFDLSRRPSRGERETDCGQIDAIEEGTAADGTDANIAHRSVAAKARWSTSI